MSVDLRDGDARAQQGKELVRRTRDVAGAEHENEVAAAHDLEQGVGEALASGHPPHVQVPAALESLVERIAAHARDRSLAGRVDLGEEQQVGVVEGAEEVVEEVARAGEPVRLERHQQPAREPLAGGAQRGADLLRMVTVVVHHENATLLAPYLEAPMNAAELLER